MPPETPMKSELKPPSKILGIENYSLTKKYFSYERVAKEHLNVYKKLLLTDSKNGTLNY